MSKLTKRVVDAIEPDPGGRESFRWDSGGYGVGLHVRPG